MEGLSFDVDRVLRPVECFTAARARFRWAAIYEIIQRQNIGRSAGESAADEQFPDGCCGFAGRAIRCFAAQRIWSVRFAGETVAQRFEFRDE